MKRELWKIPIILAIVALMVVSVSADQPCAGGDGSAMIGMSGSGGMNTCEYIRIEHDLCSGPSVLFEVDSLFSSSATPAPEFPTIAVPAGLLVGVVYIVFLLKSKARKEPSYQQKGEKSRVKEEFIP